jgi:sulfite exporter TauE/SafE
MELWTAFMLGLAGSAHCAGMCGPLALALPGGGRRGLALLPNRVFYNAGRVTTYCLLGVVFGLVGRSLALAGVQRWVSIALGVAMLVGVFVARARALMVKFALPVAWLKKALGRLLQRQSLASQYWFGVLNGLLPCGLVYIACVGAAATGGLFSGVEYMLVFGLGTVPMMLALSLAGQALPFSFRLRLQKLIPVCLAVVAVLLILRGLALGIPYLSPDLTGDQPGACCR